MKTVGCTKARLAGLVLVTMVSLVGCQGFGLLDQPPQVAFSVSPDPKVASIKVGDLVTLDASASTDPQGYPLTYQWELKGPTQSTAVLSSSDAQVVTFVPDVEASFRVSLVVTAKALSDYSESVLIEVKPADLLYPELTIQSDSHGSVTPASHLFQSEGESLDISAVADTNYAFKEWSIVSGSPVIDDKTKAVTKVTLASGKATIKAVFVSTLTPPQFLAWTSSLDTAHPNTLVKIDGVTGTSKALGGTGFVVALAYASSTLYGAGNPLYATGTRLYAIDPSLGTLDDGKVFHTATETSVAVTALAASPLGTLYAVESAEPRRLFSVDPATGLLTFVGTPTTALKALAFSSGGVLYGSSGKTLYKVSTTTGRLTSVGDFGEGISLSSLTFGPTGTLYGAESTSPTLRTVNVDTGAATTFLEVDSAGLLSLVADPTASNTP